MALWFLTLFLSALLAVWLLYQTTRGLSRSPQQHHPVSLSFKWALSIGILLVPFVSLGLYAVIGSPHLPAQPFEQAVMAQSAKNFSQQLVQAQVSSQRNPHDAAALEILGRLYRIAGYAEEARLTYQRLIAQHGAAGEKLIAQGEAQELRHFIRVNLAHLEEKRDQNPQDVQAWVMLIRAYHILDRDAEIQAACAQAKHQFTPMPTDLSLCFLPGEAQDEH